MDRIRDAIAAGRFGQLRRDMAARSQMHTASDAADESAE